MIQSDACPLALIEATFGLKNDHAMNSGTTESAAAMNDITAKFVALKIKPLLKLMNAEANPTSRSFVPCVRERSRGES